VEQLDLNKPLAICFGQESKGISDTFIKHANEYISIPQYGFTESYNVAVAAGMILLPIMEKIRKSNLKWQLNEKEKELLYKQWLINYTEKIAAHYKHFLSKQ
jgi:tRNA (guanosine-2'-O-)-methyltransferase